MPQAQDSRQDALVTDRGPFDVEIIGKTIRVIDSKGGDVLVIGRVTRPGARTLAESIAARLNLYMDDPS